MPLYPHFKTEINRNYMISLMQAANKANFLQVWHHSPSKRDRTLCSTSRFWKGRNGFCKGFTGRGQFWQGKANLVTLEATTQREKSHGIDKDNFDGKHVAGASTGPSEQARSHYSRRSIRQARSKRPPIRLNLNFLLMRKMFYKDG
jgi:hypothetical protein